MKIPEIPSPAPDHGWLISEDGLLEPQWTSGDILPQQLVDVINPASADSGAGHESEEDSDDDSRDSSAGESSVEIDSAPEVTIQVRTCKTKPRNHTIKTYVLGKTLVTCILSGVGKFQYDHLEKLENRRKLKTIKNRIIQLNTT